MTTRLAVPDIHCNACQTAIERALEPLPGVTAVEVDLAGRVVDVVHRSSVDGPTLTRAVEGQGYEVAAHAQVA